MITSRLHTCGIRKHSMLYSIIYRELTESLKVACIFIAQKKSLSGHVTFLNSNRDGRITILLFFCCIPTFCEIAYFLEKIMAGVS